MGKPYIKHFLLIGQTKSKFLKCGRLWRLYLSVRDYHSDDLVWWTQSLSQSTDSRSNGKISDTLMKKRSMSNKSILDRQPTLKTTNSVHYLTLCLVLYFTLSFEEIFFKPKPVEFSLYASLDNFFYNFTVTGSNGIWYFLWQNCIHHPQITLVCYVS